MKRSVASRIKNFKTNNKENDIVSIKNNLTQLDKRIKNQEETLNEIKEEQKKQNGDINELKEEAKKTNEILFQILEIIRKKDSLNLKFIYPSVIKLPSKRG